MSARKSSSPAGERRDELLADRATVGLDEAGRAELDELGGADDDSFDLAAAAFELATLGPLPALPDELAQRVLAPAIKPEAPAASVAAVTPLVRRPRATAAWVAAAAGLAAGTIAVVWASQRPPEIRTEVRTEVRTVQVAPVPPPPEEARAQLLATARDAVTLAWAPTADPAATGVSGDVVWSPSAQQGFMRFHGLAANDRAVRQYQLWIFDKKRDDKYPVDGGVFDVPASGDLVVRIDPKLRVNDVALFAITIEPPGGVVVSKREHIVVTAAPKV